jgi:hypothetical protein
MGEGAALVEIAGVAGAGKSTLVALLRRRDPRVRRAEFIGARSPRHAFRVLHALPGLVPILLRNAAMPPRLSWADVKLLAYVAEWDRVLGGSPGVTLLDQGPIYALVRLKARGRGVTRTAAFGRWWDAQLVRWASRISLVVLLDAGDDMLLERIDGRPQVHRAKGAPAAVGSEFLGRYRRLFEETLDRIAGPGGPRVVRFDTTSAPAERVAAEVAPMLSATPLPQGVRR